MNRLVALWVVPSATRTTCDLIGVDRTEVKGATAILDPNEGVASRPFFHDKAGFDVKVLLTRSTGGGADLNSPLEHGSTRPQ